MPFNQFVKIVTVVILLATAMQIYRTLLPLADVPELELAECPELVGLNT